MKKFASLEKSLTFRLHPFSEGSPQDQVHKHVGSPDLHPRGQESGSDSSWRPGSGCAKLQAPLQPLCFQAGRMPGYPLFAHLPTDFVLSRIGGHRRRVEICERPAGGGGGHGARRVGAHSTALGHLPCCSLLQLFAGTMICPSVLRQPGCWCCWTFPVEPALGFPRVKTVRLRFVRKTCLGFSLFRRDS